MNALPPELIYKIAVHSESHVIFALLGFKDGLNIIERRIASCIGRKFHPQSFYIMYSHGLCGHGNDTRTHITTVSDPQLAQHIKSSFNSPYEPNPLHIQIFKKYDFGVYEYKEGECWYIGVEHISLDHTIVNELSDSDNVLICFGLINRNHHITQYDTKDCVQLHEVKTRIDEISRLHVVACHDNLETY